MQASARITSLAHESSFETSQGASSVTSAPWERSADVQDLGMWQVWLEQPVSPSEVSNLELPRKRSSPRSRSRDTGIVVVDASPTMHHDRSTVHVEQQVAGIISNRGRAVASLRLCRAPLQLWWRRRPRSFMPSSGSLCRSMSL